MKGYVWGLDLVRFAAALMVVFFHLSWEQPDPQIHFDPGWVGVEIFFVISGFVIMGSACKATPIEFLERRFARLYPAALCCALISVAVLRPFGYAATAQHIITYPSLAPLVHSILLVNGTFIVSALWTLPIELAFYGLILVCIITGVIRRVTLLAGLLIIWSALYLVPFALTEYGMSPIHVGPLGYGSANLSLLRHGCFFGVGMLIWQVLHQRSRAIDLATLAGGITLCFVEIIARCAELQRHYAYPIRSWSLLFGTLATFSLAVGAIWLFGRINDRLNINDTAQRIMRVVGLMTYPLYLMHEAVGGVTLGLLRQAGYGQGLALLTGLALSLLASLLVVEAFEPWVRRRMLAILHPILERLTANVPVANVLGTFSARS